jgi:signal transduction histidine kinase/DNA-binding response OmpR family regulator
MNLAAEQQPESRDTAESLRENFKRLEIKYKQLQNSLYLTELENKENLNRNLELLEELSSKNAELENLKSNLEALVDEKTAELRKTAHALRGRDKMLEASAEIGTSLLAAAESIDLVIAQCLRLAGETFKVHSVAVFQNRPENNAGGFLASLAHLWTDPDAGPETPRTSPANPKWPSGLRDGVPLNGPVREIPEAGELLVINPRAKSILLVPIFLRGAFWGCVAFSDFAEERQWSTGETAIIKSIGSAMAGALLREKSRADLENAARQAEAATKAKSEFLANMSHELRNPLNGVIGMIELLKKTKLDDRQIEYLGDLAFSSESLLSIINDILDISKIEAGKLEFEYVPFNLRNVADRLCSMMRHTASRKNIDVDLVFPKEAPEDVVGDHVRIRQILVNLMSNAVKFTAAGKITLSVRALLQDEKSALAEFAVSDTGIGIPAHVLPKLFEKFTQGDSSTTKKYGGTGLGLAICKSLVEKMGGLIKAESKEGSGSVFSFTLPLQKAPAVRQLNGELSEISWVRQPTVLLVDDNAINRKIASVYLQDFGFTVQTAENGGEAVDICAKETFDIVFMDIQMPVMDGIQAVYKIRNEIKKMDLPIIAMTASALGSGRDKCIKAGMNDYMSKPIQKNKLYEKVVQRLQHLIKSAAAPGPSAPSAPRVKSDKNIHNRKSALALMSNNAALLDELLGEFVKITPGQIQDLERFAAAGDFYNAQVTAHSIKGESKYLQMKGLADAAFVSEKLARDQRREKLIESVSAIKFQFERVKNYLASQPG